MSKSEIGANRLDDAARAGPLNHSAALTLEEVGVKVNNLRYFSSQGWPFPNSLMIAFATFRMSLAVV